jgi:hypothetical protein
MIVLVKNHARIHTPHYYIVVPVIPRILNIVQIPRAANLALCLTVVGYALRELNPFLCRFSHYRSPKTIVKYTKLAAIDLPQYR